MLHNQLALLAAATPWRPQQGPQAQAYLSLADELYYGGAAGGGKTQLLIGLALTAHRDSLILRRRAVDARAIAKVLADLGYGRWVWRGAGGELRTPDGRTIEVGGCEHEQDKSKYQGQPHDLIAFDELPQFTLSQYQFIIGWNRVLRPERFPTQRCRVVGAGNPPTSAEGEWVIRRWRAWLDPTAGRRAQPGELRWYTTIDGQEVECPDGQPLVHRGQTYQPRSRSFIPARLEDNPALARTGYAATLEALPEPLRSMLRYGRFDAHAADDPWQLIPSRWLALAQQRWQQRQSQGFGAVSAVGVDVARGGNDETVLAVRCGASISTVIRRPGVQTPDGHSVLALLMAACPEPVPVQVDAVGVGAAVCDLARAMGWHQVIPVVASAASHWQDPRVPHLRMANMRSAMYWHLRTLLDPEGGREDTRLALPTDADLARELLALRYELRVQGVVVESKDKLKERLGRSPDAADAVALACWSPTAAWA
jgi:hypothetical protein